MKLNWTNFCSREWGSSLPVSAYAWHGCLALHICRMQLYDVMISVDTMFCRNAQGQRLRVTLVSKRLVLGKLDCQLLVDCLALLGTNMRKIYKNIIYLSVRPRCGHCSSGIADGRHLIVLLQHITTLIQHKTAPLWHITMLIETLYLRGGETRFQTRGDIFSDIG